MTAFVACRPAVVVSAISSGCLHLFQKSSLQHIPAPSNVYAADALARVNHACVLQIKKGLPDLEEAFHHLTTQEAALEVEARGCLESIDLPFEGSIAPSFRLNRSDCEVHGVCHSRPSRSDHG